jgi:hypothetical protein
MVGILCGKILSPPLTSLLLSERICKSISYVDKLNRNLTKMINLKTNIVFCHNYIYNSIEIFRLFLAYNFKMLGPATLNCFLGICVLNEQNGSYPKRHSNP